MRRVLFEQGFGTLAGGAQLRDAAVTCGPVQAVDAFDQGLYVLAGTRHADGFAVGVQ